MKRPFRNAQFRRLFIGRVITNLGDSLYFVAAMWLVHELTGDPFYTGVAGFVTLLPGAFQFLAGPLVDKWPIRRTLVASQALQAILVVTIPVAHFYDALTVEVVLVVMPVLATLNEFANPAMVTALPRLLDDDDLVAANSAFSVAKQGMDMVGQGGAGLLLSVTGAVSLFVFDAVTFGLTAVLFATLAIPPAGASDDGTDSGPSAAPGPDEPTAADGGPAEASTEDSYVDELRLGIDYIRRTFIAWLLLGAVVINSTAGMALAAMPSYAESLTIPAALALVGASGAYGILMAAFAAGNFAGAIAANLADGYPFGRTVVVGLAIAGGIWISAILVNWLPATAVLFALAFVPIGIINIQLVALVQSAPPEEVVGRITSVLGSVSVLTLPVGSLIGGTVAGIFGARYAMLVAGVALVAMAVYVLAIPGLRDLPRIEEVSI